MTSGADPIERLREGFEVIEPDDAQLDRWRKAMTTTRHRRALEAAVAGEPVPWRLIAGGALAATITVVVALTGAAPTSTSDRQSMQAMILDSVVALAPKQEARTTPADGGMAPLDAHVPATGLDLPASWRPIGDALRRTIGVGVDDEAET